jgi:hypothetical protein
VAVAVDGGAGGIVADPVEDLVVIAVAVEAATNEAVVMRGVEDAKG